MKEVICCIFWILSAVGLFIWAGCNIDIASSSSSSEAYRMNNYRNVVIVDKHYDWDLSRAAKKKKIEKIINKETKQENV